MPHRIKGDADVKVASSNGNVRDSRGSDVGVTAGDTVVKGANGEVLVVPANVAQGVFEEYEEH